MAYLSHHSALVLLAIGFFLAASNRPYTKQSGIQNVCQANAKAFAGER